MAEFVVSFAMRHRVIPFVAALTLLAPAQPLAAQTGAGTRAVDIPVSPLTVEGGGAKSAAARDAYRAAAVLADRRQSDSALVAYGRAGQIARQELDSVTLADALYRKGFLHWSRGQYEQAIPVLDSARAIRMVIGDDAELARVVNTLGASHYQLGLYEPAINAFEVALRLRRKGTDTAGLVRTLSNIGKTYHDWDQLGDAHRILTEAITVAGTDPSRASALGYALNSRALVNIDWEKYTEAREDVAASRAAYARFRALDPRADTVDSWELNVLADGLLALRERRQREALPLLEAVRASAAKRGSVRAESRALLYLGDAHQQLGETGRARTAYEAALRISSTANQRTLMLASLNRLATMEEAAGNTATALKLLRQYNTLWNVIFDQDAMLRINSREARQATDAALRENQQQQLVIERQTVTMRLALVIIALVIALLVLFARFSARERSRARALAQANRDLSVLNDELRAALNDVKTLSGLIPICANCKRIRDDQGYWNQVEAYLEDRSDAKFSHSICQSCGPTLYGELWPDQPA